MSNPTHDDHDESHGSIRLYLGVFLALCALTTLSFLTYFPWWREAVPTEMSQLLMMAVSCTKAMLVIMFFMHLKWEANWKWVLTVPASIMSALLIFALIPDVGLRMRNASYQRMIHAAERPAEGETEHVTGGEAHEGEGQHGEGHHEETQELELDRPAA
jgi:cytochrome c oxidase subunit 4